MLLPLGDTFFLNCTSGTIHYACRTLFWQVERFSTHLGLAPLQYQAQLQEIQAGCEKQAACVGEDVSNAFAYV